VLFLHVYCYRVTFTEKKICYCCEFKISGKLRVTKLCENSNFNKLYNRVTMFCVLQPEPIDDIMICFKREIT